ncbi:hypothetical protein [Virgibacillus necropolis]|uniref:hypothetical protein n=1 Tax=Virgibacillus necropolis TaxID=163877 RepID=UPI001374842A|nr:hypothetical protein [Virgibacillus necropolis]
MEKIIYRDEEINVFPYIIIFLLSLLTVRKIMRIEELKMKLKTKMAQEFQDLHML